MAPASSARSPPKGAHLKQSLSTPFFFFFPPFFSVIHPSLQSRGATVTRPGHNSCLASLKDQDNS